MKPKYHAHRESLGDKVFMALAIQKGVVDQTLSILNLELHR